MTDWHPDSDRLVELALAEVDAAEQERLVAHLAACATCRDEYAGLSDGLQQVLAATPAIAPPPGFSGRVVAAMATNPEPSSANRRPALRLLVAAALIGVLAGVGGTLAVTTLGGGAPVAASQQPVATRLLTAEGDEVGSVGLAVRGGRVYLLLNITDGRPGASYECILVGPAGERSSGGHWTLDGEYGTDAASGSWMVPITGDPPAAVELVADSGTVWARGSF